MSSIRNSLRPPRWTLAPAVPVLAHAALLWSFDLAARPLRTLVLAGIGLLGLIPAARRLGSRPAASLIVGVALLLRLLLLPLPPSLSDDVYRYVWDGRVVGAGYDPYLLAPEDPTLTPLRDDLWERLPHREVPTIYPPLALAGFSIAARSDAPVLAWKALVALVDLGGCALLLLVARRLGIPEGRVVWYAWNPLVTLETAGMGHVDALGVAAVLLATWWVLRRPPRPVAAGLAAAAAVLAKLVPLVALPLWAGRSRRPAVFWAVAVGVIAAALAPIGLAAAGPPPGLTTYGLSWEFNGPLFEPLWRTLERLRAPAGVALLLDRLKLATGELEPWNRLHSFNYPQLLAKLILAPGLLVALAVGWRSRRLAPGLGRVFSAVVLFSATVYPWYLLWVLPWAALCGQVAWLALSWLILLSYLPQVGLAALFPWIWLAVWGPFFLLLAWRPRWSID